MYQRKVDVDMLNTVKSVLTDVSSVSPSSEQRALIHSMFYHYANSIVYRIKLDDLNYQKLHVGKTNWVGEQTPISDPIYWH